MSTYVQGSLLEKGYLLRTLGAIAHEQDRALTELVVNRWDEGAAAVHIPVPDPIDDARRHDDGVTSDASHTERRVHRALLKADREMPNDEMPKSNHVLLNLPFTVYPANYPSLWQLLGKLVLN